MAGPILLDIREGVARLTLNRPDAANAINVAAAEAILEMAVEVAEDRAISAVVLTGSGRLFCAGGDIREFAGDPGQAHAIIARITASLHAGMLRLATMDKPLVTLINGPAAGAGLGLAMLGDVVLASTASHFTSAYTAIGMSPDAATSWLLPRLVGLRAAQEMILTNRRISAEEARSMGLVTAVAPPEELEAELQCWLGKLSASPTSALGTSRRLLTQAGSSSLAEHLEREAQDITRLAAGKEGQERISEFLKG